MRKLFTGFLALLMISGLMSDCIAADKTHQKNPSQDMKLRVQELSNLRFGMFVCWSFSTFSNVEWTRNVKDLSWFNPTGCDTDQWARMAKDAGMGYILFLTKHHDGFCLWDTDTTDWKVTKSPLGIDVLRRVRKSCDKYGLKLALYFSEGDWTWPDWKNPEKKKNQLKELLTRYGPVEYIWFDHAQTDGGLNHEETTKWVKKFQPDCFVGFNHGEPAGDIRLGEMGAPSSLDDAGGAGFNKEHMKGYKGYLLAEFTYPILRGRGTGRWFYTMPEWDNVCISAEDIYKDYLGAVKFGNIFSLDVGPDRSGRLRDVDVKTLQKVGRYVRGEINLPPEPVSRNKPCRASSIWDKDFGPQKAFDGDWATRWGAEEGSRSGWLEVDLQKETTISKAVIDEGDWDRIRKFRLEVKTDTGWQTMAEGDKIGKLELIFEPVVAKLVRLNILESAEVPTILSFDLYPPFDNDKAKVLPRPSPQQLAWHEMEIQMFVCLDPCTWQNREYDDHSTPLSEINPEKLDTDQWCRVAKSFGAKQILFVAKHTGGFCWWQTDTTDYSIKNTPWKNGKGDVLAELADSCQRHGLRLGIYVYPGDDTWGAPMGSGGKTRDPEKQEGYNKVFRQQMTEVLSKYGPVGEVWFDGSCVIEVGDILKKYAPDAVVFQGPHATIRWVGNERGIAPEPNWNTVKKKDAVSGVATSVHGDPDGDVWLPNEVDTTLLDHKWFWGRDTDHMIKSLDHLMDIYYKSVGRGSVLLLNSTPDITGLIPESHVKRYAEFGDEIDRRFGSSIAETKGVGNNITLSFDKPTVIDHIISMEDIQHGQRVREYVIEGFYGAAWQKLFEGTSIGYKKIDYFDPIEVTKLRLRIIKLAAKPLIKRLAVFSVKARQEHLLERAEWRQVSKWSDADIPTGGTTLELDLTPYIRMAGQYEIQFRKTSGTGQVQMESAELFLEGMEAPAFISRVNDATFSINRTAAVETDKGTTSVRLRIRRTDDCSGSVLIRQVQ